MLAYLGPRLRFSIFTNKSLSNYNKKKLTSSPQKWIVVIYFSNRIKILVTTVRQKMEGEC